MAKPKPARHSGDRSTRKRAAATAAAAWGLVAWDEPVAPPTLAGLVVEVRTGMDPRRYAALWEAVKRRDWQDAVPPVLAPHVWAWNAAGRAAP